MQRYEVFCIHTHSGIAFMFAISFRDSGCLNYFCNLTTIIDYMNTVFCCLGLNVKICVFMDAGISVFLQVHFCSRICL